MKICKIRVISVLLTLSLVSSCLLVCQTRVLVCFQTVCSAMAWGLVIVKEIYPYMLIWGQYDKAAPESLLM